MEFIMMYFSPGILLLPPLSVVDPNIFNTAREAEF
jgi:hypothetical protein